MGGPFHSLSIASSGMNVYQTWLDAVSDNVANINNITSTDEDAFRQRFIVAQAVEDRGGRPGGVAVARAEFGSAEGRILFDPEHPLADDEGFVRGPDMNLTDQMTHLLAAQRAYQANVAAFERARDSYLQALEIGR